MKKILFTALALLPWLLAEAGGFQVVLQGVRQTSMGNTAVGQAADAASVFFNPGAVAMLNENFVAAGGNFINSNISYAGPFGSAESDNPLSTPFYLYAVYGIGPDGAEGMGKKMKVSLAVVTPFGSSVRWEDDWTGQAALRSLTLRSIFIQPTFSYQINEKLGVGAGVDVVLGSVNLQRALPLTTADNGNINGASIELDGRANVGLGFNLGVYYKPLDILSVGLNYRSRVDVTVEGGDITYPGLPISGAGATDPFENLLFPSGATFDATLPLPAVLTFGLGFYPMENLTIAADVRYTFWDVYEELRLDFDQPVGGAMSSVSARNYENSFTFSLGAEYGVTDAFKVRAGGYFDMTPVPDGYMTPETPDANALGLTLGVGYTFAEKFTVDAGFLYINREFRSQVAAPEANTLDGEYETKAYIPSIGVSYKF